MYIIPMPRKTTDRALPIGITLRASNFAKLNDIIEVLNKRLKTPITPNQFLSYLVNVTLETKFFKPIILQVAKFSDCTIRELDNVLDKADLFGNIDNTLAEIDKDLDAVKDKWESGN